MMNTPQLPIDVLFVEDNPDFADVTLTSLQFAGIYAHHAENGEKALEYLEARKPDLILLDLNLPGMGGWQVLKRVRELYGILGVPVIVTSAFGDPTNRMIGKFEFVSRYLVKPFTPKQLVQAIDEVLELYKLGVS